MKISMCFFLFLIFLSFTTKDDKTKSSVVYNRNDYKAISDLIPQVFKNSTLKDTLVFPDSAFEQYACGMQLRGEFLKIDKNVFDEVFQSYCDVNYRKSYKIYADSITLNYPTKNERDFFKGVDSLYFLDTLSMRSSMLVGFSKPGYSKDYKKCLIYFEYWLGQLNGSGDMYFLEFVDNNWKVVARSNIWVS